MALSNLLKHIYTLGTDEVIKRGKKIYTNGFAELVEHDELFGSATFRVKDDTYATNYKVYILKFKDPDDLSIRCTCPYNLGDICRHEVASLFQLQEMLDKGILVSTGLHYDQRHTVAKMKTIDFKTIKMLSSSEIVDDAQEYLKVNKANILSAESEIVKANVAIDNKTYSVIIKKNDERNFDTSCDYVDSAHVLCLPKVIVFLQLLYDFDNNFFDTIRNWENEKNKLLQIYGYSLKDNIKGKFEFIHKNGKPFLRVLDPTIKRIAPVAATTPKPLLYPAAIVETDVATEQNEVEQSTEKTLRRIGMVIQFNQIVYPYFNLHAITGETDEDATRFVDKVSTLDISRYIETDNFPENDLTTIALIRKLQPVEITKYVQKNAPFSNFNDSYITQTSVSEIAAEDKQLINEYIYPRLKKITENKDELLAFILPMQKPFITANIDKIELTEKEATPQFTIKKTDEGGYQVFCNIKIEGIGYALPENESPSLLFYIYNNKLYFWKNHQVIPLLEKFLPTGTLTIPLDEWSKELEEFIIPLSKQYHVVFEKKLIKEIKNSHPEIKVLLIEKGDYLILQPEFIYNGFTAQVSDRNEIIVAQGNTLLKIYRDAEKETLLRSKIETLHSGFIVNENNGSLALRGTDVLKNNWFFLFVDAMKDLKIPVFGFDALKNFRFNTAKPQTKIFISSNTDWFDAKVDITFGNQKITVSDVKKALANKQQYVQLSDGTLGILPEEWLKKYALLFRVGDGQNNNLKLSHYHLNVIDELYENRNEEELLIQLEQKYENLRNFNNIEPLNPPEDLEKILRPYQIAGFQWLNYLSDIGWGGILADDMGLGKTLQALSFLLYYKNKYKQLNALVVCPTTLIYNWENEIKKFTPSLSRYIHHGPDRLKLADMLTSNDIIITTYGTLRSDIKLFLKHEFDYAILDESQAIKNPASKVTKAANLLQVKNRLCMSGTPLQNNTFDVFAQMNFLNPGILGSQEFFRQEFAIPIDRLGEADRKEHLRKILYPFILRRTKEQVAKDLPEKQEMILWCEMEDEQRKIYDAYRNEFRNKILGNIQEQGIQKSQLNILQGLMKLRQICDSPAILNEDEKYENHSIKIEELSRELIENISNHKTLIFSQFLGMLALIKEKLLELEVKFEYFDGNTSAPDREKAIQSFQKNDEVRVFLISLKAGGVGLNLTAADYVYIVDPWWNPAVEQQAIDRTHRIGQTKNIFAYRMICKDTIEDKILVLQEKKRILARELIADDSSFIKTLSREDVEYLFS